MEDLVNHPPHYISKNGLETIDVIEAFTSDMVGIEAACTANMIKYACRWKHKNGIQDIEKLIWYANRLIEHLKNDRADELEKVKDSFNTDMVVMTGYDFTVGVLGYLKRQINRNGYCTINDFLDCVTWCRKNKKDIYSKYGWHSLDAAPIIKVTKDKESYIIGFPEIERIDI